MTLFAPRIAFGPSLASVVSLFLFSLLSRWPSGSSRSRRDDGERRGSRGGILFAAHFQKVSDVEVLGAEYEHLTGVFGARMRIVRMRLGSEFLDLTQYLAPPGRPIPQDSRSNDLWFQHIAIVVRDMDRAFEKLRALKVQFVSTGPQTLAGLRFRPRRGSKRSTFAIPTGTISRSSIFRRERAIRAGSSRTRSYFSGSITPRSASPARPRACDFYQDLLGLEKKGESENFGTEQEHLNQVFGAHLLISGLRASGGPGVEFLEYLTPRDGRPRPAGTKANDLVHWQTTMATDDVAALAQKLKHAHASFVSSDVVVVPRDKAGFSQGRDGERSRRARRFADREIVVVVAGGVDPGWPKT